jgi:hypothetical protein
MVLLKEVLIQTPFKYRMSQLSHGAEIHGAEIHDTRSIYGWAGWQVSTSAGWRRVRTASTLRCGDGIHGARSVIK